MPFRPPPEAGARTPCRSPAQRRGLGALREPAPPGRGAQVKRERVAPSKPVVPFPQGVLIQPPRAVPVRRLPGRAPPSASGSSHPRAEHSNLFYPDLNPLSARSNAGSPSRHAGQVAAVEFDTDVPRQQLGL